MNKTELEQLRNQLAELQAEQPVWWHYLLMWTRALTWLLISLVALFVLIDVLTSKRWLRAGQALTDEEIPEFVTHPGTSNHTNTLSVSEMRLVHDKGTRFEKEENS